MITSISPSTNLTTFRGDTEIVEGVLDTLAGATTYEAEQMKPSMTLMGYLQLDPEQDIPKLVFKINERFSIRLKVHDLIDHDVSIDELIDLVSSEIEFA